MLVVNITCVHGTLNSSCVCPCTNLWSGSSCSVCSVGCQGYGQLLTDSCSCLCPTNRTGSTCQEAAALLQFELNLTFSTFAGTTHLQGDLTAVLTAELQSTLNCTSCSKFWTSKMESKKHFSDFFPPFSMLFCLSSLVPLLAWSSSFASFRHLCRYLFLTSKHQSLPPSLHCLRPFRIRPLPHIFSSLLILHRLSQVLGFSRCTCPPLLSLLFLVPPYLFFLLFSRFLYRSQ